MVETTLHKLDEKEKPVTPSKPLPVKNFIIVLVIIVAAVLAGRFAAQLSVKSTQELPQVSYTQKDSLLSDNAYGQKNAKLCPDQAEGTLKDGGIDGEGTHHLERRGGKSQNVYLTSSTVDLAQLVGKKVQVWGKTYAAQVAGWLMDVCYLEVK